MKYLAILISFCLLSCHKEKDNAIDPATKASFHAYVNKNEISVLENDRMQINDSSIIWNPSLVESVGNIDKAIYSFELYLGGFISIDKMPKNSISIDFVNYISNSQIDTDGVITKSTINEIFKEGVKSFSFNVLEQPGILIEWYDLNRHRWTTNHYLNVSNLTSIPVEPNFSNSTFEVVKSIDISPISAYYKYSKYLEISFNCNLYDVNGDSIRMTNAFFKGIYSIPKHN